jgi:hypothetical protein
MRKLIRGSIRRSILYSLNLIIGVPMENPNEPLYEDDDVDLPGEVAIVVVLIVGGLLALPFSVNLAMLICFGGLFLYAGYLAVRPTLGRHLR